MRVFLLTCVLAVAAGLVSASDLSVLENIDFVAMMNDKRYWEISVDGFLKDKPMPKDIQIISDAVTEVLRTNCAKCSTEFKSKVDRVVKILQEKYPRDYIAIMQKVSRKE